MNGLLAALTLIAAATSAQAQVPVAINDTNFPDPEFRKIVATFDKDNDGHLSTNEIAAVTS